MTKKAHVDGEQKPAPLALRSLEAWLDANGLRRVALVEPLHTNQMQLSRIFAGTGYLSATQRRALAAFTNGAVTVAMLEGKEPPVAKQERRRGVPTQPAPAPVAPPMPPEEPAGPTPRPQTSDEVERIVDTLAAKAMPAAFKVILEQMVKGKSESERRRCAEILIEHLRGKAKQYEKREQLVQPVANELLLRKLHEIESNLRGARKDGQP